ncbi:MAG: hypothetical protein ACXADO_11470 [Candidatus Thorarchaeota archaeon]
MASVEDIIIVTVGYADPITLAKASMRLAGVDWIITSCGECHRYFVDERGFGRCQLPDSIGIRSKNHGCQVLDMEGA